jgi:diketogulonate reductase-like aldo/keto reductase
MGWTNPLGQKHRQWSTAAPRSPAALAAGECHTQKFLQENNVQVEAWAPFAEGRNNIFKNELLVSIAAKYRKSVAHVILRWLVQRGIIALAKSTRKERMIENISVFDFELGIEEMAAIATLDTKTSSFFDHRDPQMVTWLGERKPDV